MLFRRHNQGPWARNRAPPCRSLPEIMTVRKVLCRNEEIYMKKRAANMIPIITSIDKCGRGWGRSCPWNGRPWRQIAARHQLASGLKAMQKSMQSLCCLPYWWAEHINIYIYIYILYSNYTYMILYDVDSASFAFIRAIHHSALLWTIHCMICFEYWALRLWELREPWWLPPATGSLTISIWARHLLFALFSSGMSRNSEEIETTVDLPGSARAMYL